MVMSDFIRLSIDLLVMPWAWHKRLSHISVPKLLMEIEQASQKAEPIHFSPELLLRLVKYRTRYTIRWRKNPCLLGGILLFFLLYRAGLEVTLHLGCKYQKGRIFGHCWISSPQLKSSSRFQRQGDMQKIFSKTIGR